MALKAHLLKLLFLTSSMLGYNNTRPGKEDTQMMKSHDTFMHVDVNVIKFSLFLPDFS